MRSGVQADGARGVIRMNKIIHYPEHVIGPDPGGMGWVDDRRWVEDVLTRLPNPEFAETQFCSAMSEYSQEAGDVMPWTLEERALGERLRAHFQRRGTCVSQAGARMAQFTILADMVMRNEAEEWVARVHPGSLYGISRVEVGGGQIRGDGSVGAWLAKGIVDYGMLFRIEYPGYDLTGDNDETFAIEWGNRGVPDSLEGVMRQHPITDASLVSDGETYRTVARSWKFVPCCSRQGFTTVRDQYGMCHPRGTWPHCMGFAGIVSIKYPKHPSGLETVAVYQSWGPDNPSGNDRVTLQTGEEITLPSGVFLIDIDVAHSMLSQRDSFVFAGSTGWSPIA